MTPAAAPRYRVLEKLGQGGMGVVFRAEDALLRRQVALKLVRERPLSETRFPARILHEARASAALSHPNVCTVYDVGEWGTEAAVGTEDGDTIAPGTPYIAMELVSGRDLSSMLATGPLKLREILDFATQIADGLAAAHGHGIVHRDLKPNNVMVTPEGRVKILDFGLAVPTLSEAAAEEVQSRVSTLSAQLGGPNALAGTVPYMSPEQACGKPLDARSDVFSFGVMLYEMAAGQRPFRGDSSAATMAKILEAAEAPLLELKPELPEELGRVVRRCLQKKPQDRYNDTRDLVGDLRELHVAVSSGSIQRRLAPSRPPRRRLALALGIVAGLGLVGLAAVLLTRPWRRPPPAPPKYTQVTFTGKAYHAALAPDGRFMCYWTTPLGVGAVPTKVMVQEIGGGQAIPVWEGKGVTDVRWSPDSSELLVSGQDASVERGTFLVPRLGGTPRRFEFGQRLAWSPDGSRFAAFGGSTLTFTDKMTGEKTSLRLPPRSDNPAVPKAPPGIDWASSGRWLVYQTEQGQRNMLWTIPADGGQPVEIVDDTVPIYSPRVAPRADAVYYARAVGRTSELWKAPVSPETGRPRGAARVVTTGLEGGDFTVSGDGGRLLYSKQTAFTNLWRVRLDGPGPGQVSTQQLTSVTAQDTWPNVSPDGTQVVFTRFSNDVAHVLVMPSAGGSPRQISFVASLNVSPVWSPDGKEIAYLTEAEREGEGFYLWSVAALGGAPRRLARVRTPAPWLAWAPGRRILYTAPDGRNFRLLDRETMQETPLLRKDLVDSRVSIAYFSPEAKRVVAPWSRREQGLFRNLTHVVDVDSGEAKLMAENAPTVVVVGWTPNGRAFFAVDIAEGGQTLVILPVAGGPARTVAALPPGLSFNMLAMFPDGRGFVSDVEQLVADAWLIENFDPDVR